MTLDLMRPRGWIIADLVRRRHAAGVTQEEMAELMGVKQPAIAQFENARSDPRLSTLQRYVRTLELCVAEKEKKLAEPPSNPNKLD